MAFEADLHYMMTKEHFSMKENSVIYMNTEMLYAEVRSFSYGMTKVSIHGANTRNDYHVTLVDTSDDQLDIKFAQNLIAGDNSAYAYEAMVHYAWQYFGNRIQTEIMAKIIAGEDVKIGKYTLNRAGLHFSRKPLFFKERHTTIPWKVLGHEVVNGMVTLFSRVPGNDDTSFSLRYTQNGHILLHIAQKIIKERDFHKVLTAQN